MNGFSRSPFATRTRVFSSAAFFLFLLALMPGRAHAQTTLPFRNDEARWSGSVSAGARLEIANVNGAIVARPADGPQASLVARRSGADAADLRVELVRRPGGDVTACVRYPGAPAGCDGGTNNTGDTEAEVRFEVRVPSGVRLAARTANGQIDARQMPSDVEAQTANGAIDVQAAGNVTAQSANGAVTAAAGGWAKAQTVNGAVDVTMGRTDWDGTMEVRTVNGAVTVRLPRNADTDVDAKASTGAVDAGNLPLRVKNGFVGSSAQGALGQGQRRLRVQTVSGRIALRRAD